MTIESKLDELIEIGKQVLEAVQSQPPEKPKKTRGRGKKKKEEEEEATPEPAPAPAPAPVDPLSELGLGEVPQAETPTIDDVIQCTREVAVRYGKEPQKLQEILRRVMQEVGFSDYRQIPDSKIKEAHEKLVEYGLNS